MAGIDKDPQGLEQRSSHEKFKVVVDPLRALLDQPPPPRKAIGFAATLEP